MKLIVGLGNPGDQYAHTRHNVGFMLLDRLTDDLAHGQAWKKQFQSEYMPLTYLDQKYTLIKPQTFMNLSGKSLAEWVQFYKLSPEDLIVAHDDIDLPLGKIRFKKASGHGGHNGLRSLIQDLGTRDFIRLKMGVGRPHGKTPVEKHVLQPFRKEEYKDLEDLLKLSHEALKHFCEKGLDSSMQIFNKA